MNTVLIQDCCSLCQFLLKPGKKYPWISLGLPKSKGKDTILVVVCRLTKLAHFLPLTHPFSATTVAHLFMDHIYKLHDLPKVIVSNLDKIFTSLFWQELFKSLGVKLSFSSAYHPQSDGQIERVNSALKLTSDVWFI